VAEADADMLRDANLRNTDLIVDGIYEGGRRGNAGDDPLNALLGVSNQGGFRILGTREAPRLIVLTTSLSDPDWPDTLDDETGTFIYYGDNKKPGNELHSTGRYGNDLLRQIFDQAHGDATIRSRVPPILAFTSAGPGTYRDMRFLGMLAPGAEGLPATEDLVAIWKSSRGKRFQNYRAVFTVLDVPRVKREWLNALKDGRNATVAEPESWTHWKNTGGYKPLKAERTTEFRTKLEQLPQTENHRAIIRELLGWFGDEPVRFEKCAGRIAEMQLGQNTNLNVTRPTRDGGRDATGSFRIGGLANGIDVEFALEAKCYSETNSVGVKELSRLISRLRYRQFGVLVTTSYVGAQAYQEIKEDQHPIVILSGKDVAEILETNGLGQVAELREWLRQF